VPDVAADPSAALRAHDFGSSEIARWGAAGSGVNNAVRQRLAALIEIAAIAEPAPDTTAADVRRAGALIIRLDGAATATTMAQWLGWTIERVDAALVMLDRRLDACGLRLQADIEGQLHVRDRAYLRSRPQQLSWSLLTRVDDAACLHGLAHLVRGEPCPAGQGWAHPLIELGAAVVTGDYEVAEPASALKAAFGAVSRRYGYPRSRRQEVTFINCEHRPAGA